MASMTFLELCRALARESGTVSNFGSQPATVTGQVGRNAKIVEWVAQAWIDIQNTSPSWRFRRKDFTSALITSTGEYTAASFSLTDHYRWAGGRAEPDTFTIYDASIGLSDETPLYWAPWDKFKRLYRRNVQTDDRPQFWSIDYENNLCIGSAPDMAYAFTGEYIRTAQVLAANTDVPICPADFHMIIVWYALLRLMGHDEAPGDAKSHAAVQYDILSRAMALAELPEVTTAGTALA